MDEQTREEIEEVRTETLNRHVIGNLEEEVDELLTNQALSYLDDDGVAVVRNVIPFANEVLEAVEGTAISFNSAQERSWHEYAVKLPAIRFYYTIPEVKIEYCENEYTFKGFEARVMIMQHQHDDPYTMDVYQSMRTEDNRGARDWNLMHPHTSTIGNVCISPYYGFRQSWIDKRFGAILAHTLRQLTKYSTSSPYYFLPKSTHCMDCGSSFRQVGNTGDHFHKWNMCSACNNTICSRCLAEKQRSLDTCHNCRRYIICPDCRNTWNGHEFCTRKCKMRWLSHIARKKLDGYAERNFRSTVNVTESTGNTLSWSYTTQATSGSLYSH